MLYLTNVKGETQKVADWKAYNDTIMSMSFQINNHQKIVMKGFSEYIRLLKKADGIFHNIHGTIEIILIGRAGTNVVIVTLDLIKGTVTQETKDYSTAYNNKPLNSVYWKKGVLSNPKVFLQEV